MIYKEIPIQVEGSDKTSRAQFYICLLYTSSHVLLAIGLPHEIAHGSLRLTLNEEITKEDIDYVVDSLKEIVAYIRQMSPLYEDFLKKQK